MANIMINEVCNLNCPYCFANNYVNNPEATNMSFKNFKKAVDWINRIPDTRIALIGGEPTLHPLFVDFLDYAVANRTNPEQNILVFTNLILADKFAKYFSDHNIALLANINSPEDIGEKNYNKVIDNISILRKYGVKVSLGINFYKPDLDTSFIEDIIKEFNFKDIRIGIACPNNDEERSINSLDYLRTIKNPLMEFIGRLIDLGCVPHFDCQKLPRCMYSDDDMEWCDNVRMDYPDFDIEPCMKCVPVIDILQDLTAVRCFGVSDRKLAVPIHRFNNEADLCSYFATNIDNIAVLLPASEECKTCYLKATGQCQSACLGFKKDDAIDGLKRLMNFKQV